MGILEDVLPTHGNDVYVVKDADKEILIPALKSVVLSVSVPEKKIVVRLPEGLEDVYTQKI